MWMKYHILVTLATLIVRSCALFNVYEDLFSSPKYILRYDQSETLTIEEAELLRNHSDNGTFQSMKGANGVDYLCHVPPPAALNTGEISLVDEDLNSRLNELSVRITQELANKILFYHGGYWTYAFNHKKDVAQFYGDPTAYSDDNTHAFVLGRKNPRIDFPKLEAKKDNGVVFLAHTMVGGSICDVTGKPRSVEIQYVCDSSKANTTLLWVKEYRTCHYHAQVAIPSLCSEEMLKETIVPFNEVSCKKVVGSKLRDASKVGSKIFTNSRDSINLVDYSLISLGDRMTLGKSDDGPMIIIDTGREETRAPRFYSAFTTWFPKKFVDDIDTAKVLVKERLFKFSAYVYDRYGNYLSTVVCEVNVDREDQTVIHVGFNPQQQVTKNIEQMITPELQKNKVNDQSVEASKDHTTEGKEEAEELRELPEGDEPSQDKALPNEGIHDNIHDEL